MSILNWFHPDLVWLVKRCLHCIVCAVVEFINTCYFILYLIVWFIKTVKKPVVIVSSKVGPKWSYFSVFNVFWKFIIIIWSCPIPKYLHSYFIEDENTSWKTPHVREQWENRRKYTWPLQRITWYIFIACLLISSDLQNWQKSYFHGSWVPIILITLLNAFNKQIILIKSYKQAA